MKNAVYHAANKMKRNARAAARHKTPAGREIHNLACHRRRARKTATPPERALNRDQWQKIRVLSKGKCYWCGKTCEPTIDHVIPLAKGGLHVAENVVVACMKCNRKKSAKIVTLL